MGAENTPLHEVAAKADLHGLGFDPFRVSACASAPLQTLLSRGRRPLDCTYLKRLSVLQQGYPPGCLVLQSGGRPGSFSVVAATQHGCCMPVSDHSFTCTTNAQFSHCVLAHQCAPCRPRQTVLCSFVQDAEEFRTARQHRGPPGGPQRQAGPASQHQQQQHKRTRGTAFGVGALDEDDSYGVMDDYVVDTDTDRKGAHHFELREEGEDDAPTLFGR